MSIKFEIEKRIICSKCGKTIQYFAKEDREKKENISKLKNLFNTLLEYYYQSEKSILNNIDGVVIYMNYEELEKEVNEDKNEFNRLLKQLELE